MLIFISLHILFISLLEQPPQISEFINRDLQSIVTPVNPRVLKNLLVQSNYDQQEIDFLVDGFTNGFNIKYDGPTQRTDSSNNIPFKVGDRMDMWEKIMKEVKAGTYAGPFDSIPYQYYIQSPIGLVPKAGGQTRLIFHLSFNFKTGNKSVNFFTLQEKCSVKYNDIDHAIQASFRWKSSAGKVFYSKTDLKSAFRILPLKISCFPWLILKAFHPATHQLKYFIEKKLPFGSSISCSHFQRFSNTLRHIVEHQTGRMGSCSNYLDDFIFVAPTRTQCNSLVSKFLQICQEIGVPVAEEKTKMAEQQMVFLGLLLDGENFLITVPENKRIKALNWLNKMIDNKKTTMKEVEQLAGLLNFLSRAIVPGRVFTRQMYSKFNRLTLKPYHHIRIDQEFRADCTMWKNFLSMNESMSLLHPFMDLSLPEETSETINFHSDAIANPLLGFGSIFDSDFYYQQWEPGFIERYKPSIEFLELYAVCMGVFIWALQLRNRRITLFSDNLSMVRMISNTTSGCKYCMVLVRLLTLKCLNFNMRIFAEHIKGKLNVLSDNLSWLKISEFRKEAAKMGRKVNTTPMSLSEELWPLSKFWELNCSSLK